MFLFGLISFGQVLIDRLVGVVLILVIQFWKFCLEVVMVLKCMLEKLLLLQFVEILLNMFFLLVIRCSLVIILVIEQIWLFSCGMKNEFIIEFEVIWKFIGVFFGKVILLIVVIFCFGQMNNYFQFSEMVWMVIGLILEFSGWYGLSLWVFFQVIQLRIVMIMQGISQIIVSMWLEWCQFGLYLVWVFEVWYFQVNVRVIMIIGMIMISISRVVVMIRVCLFMFICFFGLNRVMLQLLSSSVGVRESYFNVVNGFVLVIFWF